jgi:lipopolysaccharide export system protein LptA
MNSRLLLVVALLAAAMSSGVRAEKADRLQQIVINADGQGTLDYGKQVTVLSGNVVITQGTLTIRAERVEVRELQGNRRSVVALGGGGKRATFRQKREGVDEYIDGGADRIEYDNQGDVVKFIGNAQVRRTRGSTTADEVNGAVIAYDNGKETFTVLGAASGSAPTTTSDGRVRMVITPKPDPAPPASAPR